MNDAWKAKLAALNTIALWVIALVIIGWLIFKPSNTLTKDTVEKLTVSVDKIGTAANELNKAAIAQREWASSLQQTQALNYQNRENAYENLYDKYGYNEEGTSISLNDIYDRKLHTKAEGDGSSDIRGSQNSNSKTRAVQESTGKPKG